MVKYIPIILFFIWGNTLLSQVDPTLTIIPKDVFVHNGQDDFESILFQDSAIEEMVKELHAHDELSHEFPVITNNFSTYWSFYKEQWYWIQFQENSSPLLLFHGLKNLDDEREYVELYDMKKKITKRLLYSDVGNLLAYKKHPITHELILYAHKYPCCRSASHNIYKIRYLNEKIILSDRFFVGRDKGDMVGPFYPEKVNFTSEFHYLKEKTELRWSPAIVEEDAFLEWTNSNLIIHYDANAIYKKLHETEDWIFVLMLNGIVEEQSMMLNAGNFKNKGVYGWIKK